MSPQNTSGLTRGQKKNAVRLAVLYVVSRVPASELMSSHSYSDILDRIIGLIQEHKPLCFAIDERDVRLALSNLHSEDLVRVSHGKDNDYIHRVTRCYS